MGAGGRPLEGRQAALVCLIGVGMPYEHQPVKAFAADNRVAKRTGMALCKGVYPSAHLRVSSRSLRTVRQEPG